MRDVAEATVGAEAVTRCGRSDGAATAISIVMPVLDEAATIGEALYALESARARGVEVIVVDGGSRDDTRTIALPLADRIVRSHPGRAAQMNAGAAAAAGRILVFLHVDTRLPDGFDRLILDRLSSSRIAWGRFDLRIDSPNPRLSIVAGMMNARSRLTGIATGDQTIFTTRELFLRIGGFPDQPLMEDIEFSRQAKRICKPDCLRARVTTSARRWERNGIAATIVLMWRLRLAYWLGADPAKLRSRYADTR